MGLSHVHRLLLITCLLFLQACTNAVPNLSGLNLDLGLGSSTSTITVNRVEANPISGSYSLGQRVEIHIVFSDTITLTNANGVAAFPPKLKLETGTVDHDAVYTSGSGTNTLTFLYTIVTGDSSSDLNYLAIDSLDLNGGTLAGSSGQDVKKDLPDPTSTSSLAGTSSVTVSGNPGLLVLFSGSLFSNTLVGFATTQTVTIKNQSSNSITISTMAISDTTHFNFVGGNYPGTGVSSPCGTSLAASATCNLNVKFSPLSASGNLITNLNISFSDGSTAITNSFSLTGISSSSYDIAVSENYNSGALWNSYIKNDGSAIYNASGTTCSGSETGDYNKACLHAAEIKKVVVPALSGVSCSNLSIADSLNVFNWICDDSNTGPNGNIIFYSNLLKRGKGLRYLIQANGGSGSWIANSVTVTVTSGPMNGSIYATSSATSWWSNTISQLPDNTGVSTSTSLTDPNHPIYVISADQNTQGGYQIEADGISFVTLGSSILSQIGSTASSNCKNDGGSTTVGLDVRAFFCGYQKKFLWFEVNLNGGFGTVGNYAAIGIVLNGAKLTRIQNTSISNLGGVTSYGAIRLLNSAKNLLNTVKVYNATSALTLDNSSSNTIRHLQTAKISFSGTASAISLNSSNSNKFTDVQISGMVTGSLAIGVYSNFSDANIFQRFLISNIDGQSNLGYGTGIELTDATNHVLSQITIAGVEGTGMMLDGVTDVSSNYLSHINLINNTDFGLQLWGGHVSNNTFHSFVTSNNDVNISIYGDSSIPSINNMFYNTVATSSYNTDGSVYIDNNYGASFNGFTITRYGGTNTCLIGTSSVITNLTSSCTGTPESIAGSVTASFGGKVASDDSVSSVDSSGLAAFSLLNSIDKWLNFAFDFRIWGRDGSTFPDYTNQGQCDGSFTCRIWDFRVKTGTALENRSFSYSTANSTISFSSGLCGGSLTGNDSFTLGSKTFLKHAIEIDDDDIGNDNGLCESNENCVYAPNVGAYQGEDGLSATYCTTASTGVNVTNAKIFKYITTSIP